MKHLALNILYRIWEFLATRNKFPKICERINLYINKLENE